MLLSITIVNLIIDILTIISHSLGLYLLRNVKASENFPEIQRYLLIQLSVCELVCGLLFLLTDLIPLLIRYGGDVNAELIIEIDIVLRVILNLPFFILFVFTMLLITTDRFLYVYLNIRYPLVCTLRKVKILFRFFQVILVLAVLLIIIFRQDASIMDNVALFTWPIGDILFLTVAITTYSYLFKKIRENRKIDNQISSRFTRTTSEIENKLQSNIEAQSSHGTFKRNTSMKPFLMLALLILSYILFIVIPDEVYFWHLLFNIEINEQIYHIMTTLFKLGYLSDAVIYIFLQKEVFARAKMIVLRCDTI